MEKPFGLRKKNINFFGEIMISLQRLANPSVSNGLVEQLHYGCDSKVNFKELGADDDYQSALNVQKRRGAPYRAVKNEHI